MVITDVHINTLDLLSMQSENESHETVGAEMVRAHIQQKPLFAFGRQKGTGIQGLVLLRINARIGDHFGGPPRIALAEGMSFPIVRHDQAVQVRVALKADSEHVEHFPFIPVGRGPDIGDTPDGGVLTVEGHF